MMWKTVFASQIGLGPAIWRSQLSNYIIVSYLSSNKFPFVFRLDVHVANFGSGHACLLLGPWYCKYPTHLIMNGGILWSLCSFDWRCLCPMQLCSFGLRVTGKTLHGNGQDQPLIDITYVRLTFCNLSYLFKKMKVFINTFIALGLAVGRSCAFSFLRRGFLYSCAKATCGALAQQSALPLCLAVEDKLKEEALRALFGCPENTRERPHASATSFGDNRWSTVKFSPAGASSPHDNHNAISWPVQGQ